MCHYTNLFEFLTITHDIVYESHYGFFNILALVGLISFAISTKTPTGHGGSERNPFG